MLQVIAPDFHEHTVYVCGPNGFMQAVKALLDGLGFPMQNYHEQSFGAPKKKTRKPESTKNPPSSYPPPSSPAIAQPSSNGLVDSPPSPVLIASPVVVFAQSGEEVTGDGSESILELANRKALKFAAAIADRAFVGLVRSGSSQAR